ncbi:hypothetical protein F511_23561 [Dorcoceras hygrometricum]|uniref:Uncharacterized protein n=1 Tax=Dorcoceras hygrometricum TaxID=472368 RepID=A0A2Z7CQG1_9LAMI|nr:hypothetical protein F511_23561 [Dorcoceras hygrometricum]
MLNKKLTTAILTVKNDGNQQMVRVQQKKSICWSRENSQNDDAYTKPNDAASQRFNISAPADQQQSIQRKHYQQQAIRHAYVTTSIDSSRDNYSTHLLISFTNTSAESNGQRSKMLTNTRHYLAPLTLRTTSTSSNFNLQIKTSSSPCVTLTSSLLIQKFTSTSYRNLLLPVSPKLTLRSKIQQELHFFRKILKIT